MPSSITQLIVGTAVAFAALSIIGSAPAVGQTERILINQDEPLLLSETNGRIENHQQLRRLFFDQSTGRLK
jgi:altronate dehydratase